MSWAQFAILLVTVALAALAIGQWIRRAGQTDERALRQEMQAMAAQSQSVAAQLGQLAQTVTQQFGQVTQQLQSGVAATGALASEAQKAVSEQLKGSTEMLGVLRQQLGEVQQAGRELSEAARTIEMVLSGAKTRGTLGEVTLERMLEDALPQSAYETQYRFSTGAVVDAALRVGEKIVCVDSKFPLDAYRRMREVGEEAKEAARKEFAKAVRGHADAIAEKYILPEENTLDYAFMFVPSEGVYYELLMTEEARAGPLADYCRSRHVIAVSPNVFYAYLRTILMGLRGMQIEENARRLLASLSGLKRQLDTFGEVYEKLGAHLRNAQQSYTEADTRLERARAALDQMAQGAPPEAPAKALGAAAED